MAFFESTNLRLFKGFNYEIHFDLSQVAQT